MPEQVHLQFTSSEFSGLHRPMVGSEVSQPISTLGSGVVLTDPTAAREAGALPEFHKPDAAISVLESNPSSLNVQSSSSGEKSWKTSVLNVINSSPRQGQGSGSNVRRWRPTLLRLGPLSGILAMLIAGASIIASLGVLVGSNHAAITTWSTPPATYLAICVAIANLAMRYSCIQGVVIAWWYRALKGSSFEKLHYDWQAGTTIRGALSSGRHLGLLGLACIASTLVFIDGPLLQRASIVVSSHIDRPVTLNVSMAAQIPTGLTGYWQTAKNSSTSGSWCWAFNNSVPTANDGTVPNNIESLAFIPLATNLTRVWLYDSEPLQDVVRGCPGKCKAKLVAPAVAVTSCSSHQVEFDVSSTDTPWLRGNARDGTKTAPPLYQEMFLVSTTLVVEDYEKINLVTGYTPMVDCKGTLNYTICTLESAVGEYDVSLDKDAATLDEESISNPRILALSNNVAVDNRIDSLGLHGSTLAGIVNLQWLKWDSFYAGLTENGIPQGISEGAPVSAFIQDGYVGACPSFSDPHSAMIASINRLMVYTGMFAAHGPKNHVQSKMEPKWAESIQTTTVGKQVGEESVYQTNFWFFFAAALVEVLCIILIAPTYWGWWKLGRPMSFSPLDMAKAFDSPLLRECNSNSSGRDIAKALGKTDIQYGAATDTAGRMTRLVFASPSEVNIPVREARFDG